MYTPVDPSFFYIKVGCKGVFITFFRDVKHTLGFETDFYVVLPVCPYIARNPLPLTVKSD